MSEQTTQTVIVEEVKVDSSMPIPQHRIKREAIRKFGAFIDSDEESDFGEARTKHSKSRSKYHSVSDEKRLKLIKLVVENDKKIKPSARRLGINYSTAKSICQIYRKEGRTTKKDVVKNPSQKKIIRPKLNLKKRGSNSAKEHDTQGHFVSNKGSDLLKIRIEKPSHHELENQSKRKKIKVSENSIPQEIQIPRRLSRHIESNLPRSNKIPSLSNEDQNNENEDSLEQSITQIDLQKPKPEELPIGNKVEESPKDVNEVAISTNVLIKGADVAKLTLGTPFQPLPMLQQPALSMLVQQRLQQLQRNLIVNNINQRQQVINQLISQQMPQLMNQRFSQFPNQNQFNSQKNPMLQQESQLLNKIVSNNLLLNRMGIIKSIQFPQRPFFS